MGDCACHFVPPIIFSNKKIWKISKDLTRDGQSNYDWNKNLSQKNVFYFFFNFKCLEQAVLFHAHPWIKICFNRSRRDLILGCFALGVGFLTLWVINFGCMGTCSKSSCIDENYSETILILRLRKKILYILYIKFYKKVVSLQAFDFAASGLNLGDQYKLGRCKCPYSAIHLNFAKLFISPY